MAHDIISRVRTSKVFTYYASFSLDYQEKLDRLDSVICYFDAQDEQAFADLVAKKLGICCECADKILDYINDETYFELLFAYVDLVIERKQHAVKSNH